MITPTLDNTVFARLRAQEDGGASVTCLSNPDLEATVDTSEHLFIVIDGSIAEEQGIAYDGGLILIYSPDFTPDDLSAVWIAQSIDFDFFTLADLQIES